MRERIEKWRKLPFISAALVIINVAVYLLDFLIDGRLYGAGRLNTLLVVAGREYGRVLWSMFLHAGIDHLFNNMLILFFLGAMIENEVGHIKYAFLYLLSGIGGNLLSLLARIMENDWLTSSIGASGAVFGLDGVLLSMVLFSNRRMSNVTPARVVLMIFLSLYSGFTGGNIDNAAHIGGLLTGFLLGTVMCIISRRRVKQNTESIR